ncbi:terpene synthase family protein [Nocardia sp. BMG51109]|uniref:terpene synthase family protein n=1 Tax=Nocardia sp. BMG51109 TaxID=1056816 RepID=UPI0004BC6332|nr:terpene synthase family protein [Nocardia sp. BMG51109]
MAGEYVVAIEAALETMRSDHERLVREERPWSLAALFSTPDCDIVDYCRDFRPNRFGAEACTAVETFCRRHDIWLEAGGAHYNSMTPYLHPGAVTAERMTIIGMYNAILFWLNDTVGREKFRHLAPDAQRGAGIAVDGLCLLLEKQRMSPDPTSPEIAAAEFLKLLAADAEPRWLQRFLDSTADHLRTAIRDQNARARKGLLSIDEYIDLRARVSGMYPAVALCEFGRDDYLPWRRIADAGLKADLVRLRRLAVDIGALMNDMFSFEKECIIDGADFNLVPICLLNAPGETLAGAVEQAGRIVRERFTEFRLLRERVDDRCAGLPDPALAAQVRAHVVDLVGCVQATWVWQNVTRRYKGASIFTENRERDFFDNRDGSAR